MTLSCPRRWIIEIKILFGFFLDSKKKNKVNNFYHNFFKEIRIQLKGQMNKSFNFFIFFKKIIILKNNNKQ